MHVTNKHAKRVAYMSVCVAEQMGIQGKSLQDLTTVALLHDNALTQYIQEELMSFRQAAWKQQICQHFGNERGLRILDVGTGPFCTYFYLSE